MEDKTKMLPKSLEVVTKKVQTETYGEQALTTSPPNKHTQEN